MDSIKINLKQTKPLKCKGKSIDLLKNECGNETFSQVFFIRVIPALLSPTMKEEIAPMPAFRCTKCGTIAELKQKNT